MSLSLRTGRYGNYWGNDYLGGIPPVRHTKNKKFPWVLYSKIIRKYYNS